MPKAKYTRFHVPPDCPVEFEMELPEKAFLQAEVVDGIFYIAATFQADSPMKRMTIMLLEDGVEFEADHIADLGLVCVPFQPAKRAVVVSFLPPEIKAQMRAQAAGIVGATSLPPGH